MRKIKMTEQKTLSEQLCEIVGLEYKKTKIIAECRDDKYWGKVKLDFENHENFVKLLELRLEYGYSLGKY